MGSWYNGVASGTSETHGLDEMRIDLTDREFTKVDRGDFITLGDSVDGDGEVINVVEGELIDMDAVNFSGGGNTGRYRFKRDDDTEFGVLGATILDDLMRDAEVGQYYRITYTGMKKSSKGGRPTKQFDVEKGD